MISFLAMVICLSLISISITYLSSSVIYCYKVLIVPSFTDLSIHCVLPVRCWFYSLSIHFWNLLWCWYEHWNVFNVDLDTYYNLLLSIYVTERSIWTIYDIFDIGSNNNLGVFVLFFRYLGNKGTLRFLMQKCI